MTDRMTRQTLLDAFPVPLIRAGAYSIGGTCFHTDQLERLATQSPVALMYDEDSRTLYSTRDFILDEVYRADADKTGLFEQLLKTKLNYLFMLHCIEVADFSNAETWRMAFNYYCGICLTSMLPDAFRYDGHDVYHSCSNMQGIRVKCHPVGIAVMHYDARYDCAEADSLDNGIDTMLRAMSPRAFRGFTWKHDRQKTEGSIKPYDELSRFERLSFDEQRNIPTIYNFPLWDFSREAKEDLGYPGNDGLLPGDARLVSQSVYDSFPVIDFDLSAYVDLFSPLVPDSPVIGSDLPLSHNSETGAMQEPEATAAAIERLADGVTARLRALGFDVSRSGEVVIITRGRRFLMNVSDAIGLADACEQGRLSPNDVPDLILLNHSTRSE